MRKWMLGWLLGGLALSAPADAYAVGAVHEHASGRDSLDRRGGGVEPSGAQRAAAARLGARVSWNRLGAPRSVFQAGGWLAEGLAGSPEAGAREFVRRNAALFGDVSGLALVNDARLTGSDAHVVLFGRRVGGLPVAGGGTLAVGIAGGRVAYASSSLGGRGPLRGARRLTGQEAWRAAARSAGVAAGACPSAARAPASASSAWPGSPSCSRSARSPCRRAGASGAPSRPTWSTTGPCRRPGPCSSTPRPAPCCAGSTGWTPRPTSRTGSTSRTTRRSAARGRTGGSSAASRRAPRPRRRARSTSARPRPPHPPRGTRTGSSVPSPPRATTPTRACRR